jgi:UDP:flavonoid glycosyltransferase YjiC (YdhE family)
MNAKAGIRVQKQFWKVKNIRNTVVTVLKNPSYAARARMLAETLNSMDGAKTAVEVMWKFIFEEQTEMVES